MHGKVLKNLNTNQWTAQLEFSGGTTPQSSNHVKASFVVVSTRGKAFLNAHQNSHKVARFFEDSRYRAGQYAMRTGADYKYHWLLQQVRRSWAALFQSVTNPKARSLLIVLLQNISGQWFLKTKSLRQRRICCSVLSPDVGYQTLTEELRQLYDHCTIAISRFGLATYWSGKFSE